MRLRHPGGRAVHLAVAVEGRHGDSAAELLRVLDETLVPLLHRLDLDHVGISLRPTPRLATVLASSQSARVRFRQALAARGLEVYTFHVGGGADDPTASWRDWVTHVLDLARVLVDVMPDDAPSGAISTAMPAPPTGPAGGTRATLPRHLEDLTSGLAEIAWHTGRMVTVGVEPAPETVASDTGAVADLLERLDTTRIGFSLASSRLREADENPAQTVALLRRGRIHVVKIRIGFASDLEILSRGRGVLAELFGDPETGTDHLELSALEDLQLVADELATLGLQVDADAYGVSRAA